MSVTPVREALARLSAEKLVRQAPHHGYAVPGLSARRLEHLYGLNQILIDAVLQRVAHVDHAQADATSNRCPDSYYSEHLTHLFSAMARAQPNVELADQVAGLNDRLCLVRRIEPAALPSSNRDLTNISRLWYAGEIRSLRRSLRAHHIVRIEKATLLSRMLTEWSEGD